MAVYLITGSRTPSGSFMGALSTIPAPSLGAVAIRGALRRGEIEANEVDEVFMGNVISAGVGQAPARQATIFAGLGEDVPATTVNKVCGSGLQAIIFGAQTIECHHADLVVAGGMENMSSAPHMLMGSRFGQKYGNAELKDAMINDGLWDVYSQRPMGNCAEECAARYEFSREAQDAFAIESFKRAQMAIKQGVFKDEISPVSVKGKKGEELVSEDEGPFKANFDKIPSLRPAFESKGTITAANASTINDGAAAVVLASEKYKNKAKFRIVSYAGHAQAPTWFTTAPVKAMEKALAKAKLQSRDIGVFEINEAFAVVTMAVMKEMNLDHSKVNIYGGGISLGHPIGCSGARIIVTLMNAMERKQVKYGMGSICIGGGEALAIIIERI